MNYGIMGVAVPLLIRQPTFAYLNQTVPGIDPKAVKQEYKNIISRQPEVGGLKNNLIMGLYLAAYLMAVYKTAPEKITDDVFEGLVDAIVTCDRFVNYHTHAVPEGHPMDGGF